MADVKAAVACNLDNDILATCIPLFQEARIEAIEWSFDTLFRVKEIPSWFLELIQTFSKEGRLIGHGVYFSLFSGRWSEGQENWLNKLRKICTTFKFDHITEHFGFMTGSDFHKGAPLNIPYSATTLRIGQDRLKRIYDACHCPVGLENLAFSYSPDEVKRHGEFLEKLIAPVNGFIILDLHNLYCQLHNFNISYEAIINMYPLEKVREIHISGGSWETVSADTSRSIRRDTHDDEVPNEVFSLLRKTITQCPNLKYVVLEQLGTGLQTSESRIAFYNDFLAMSAIVNDHCRTHPGNSNETFLPPGFVLPATIVEDETLYEQQSALSHILESAPDYKTAINWLQQSTLAHSDWKIESWDPCMIETAMMIAKKWM